jgi:hypothetical protein
MGVAAASGPAEEADFPGESAAADCCAEFAGEEAAKASAVPNPNSKTLPILLRNTLSLRAIPG